MDFDGLFSFKPQFEDFRSNPFEFFKDPTGWLYSGWTEDKYRVFHLLHEVPLVGNYMDYLLDRRSLEEYFNRYGMDFTDVHDPRRLIGYGSTSALNRSVLNFVSDNVKSLYR